MSKKGTGLALLYCLLALDVSADIIDGEELIDPTRPIFSGTLPETAGDAFLGTISKVIPSSFEVTFVRESNRSSIAVINDQRVKIGDAIGGATVLGIDRSGVTLLVDDQERRVNLFNANVKAPVTGC